MQRYHTLGQVGDGAFGVVTKAQQQNTGEIVAVKRMKQRFQTWEECLQLREILSLRRLQHTNIIKLKEVVRENTELFLIFELMEGSVYNIQKTRTEQMGQGSGGVFNEKEIRCIMAQVLLGLQAVHKGGFMHRDLKPENLLIKGDIVKLADFGLAKEIRSRPPFTEYVSTRWYRAPEIVLRSTHYNSPIDIWAAGVIFAELYLNRALLPGSSDSDQLFKICSVLGTPNVSDWDEGYQLARKLNIRFPSLSAPPLRQQIPNASNDAIHLIEMMLRFNPSDRPTASQCLQHPFFCQQLGTNELIAQQYQGIQSGMPHNPFTAGAGPQLPGSTQSSSATAPALGSSTPMQLYGGGAGGGRSGSSNSISSNTPSSTVLNNNNNMNIASNLPPPPQVIGASAHRQSPLGMNNNNFGGGNNNNMNNNNRVSNSPMGSYHPSFGSNNNNNTNSNSNGQYGMGIPNQFGGGGGATNTNGMFPSAGGHGRSSSVSSQNGIGGMIGYNTNSSNNNNNNNMMGKSGISGFGGFGGGNNNSTAMPPPQFGSSVNPNSNNNFNGNGPTSSQGQNSGGGVIGQYGRRQSPMKQPGGSNNFNTGLAPFSNINNGVGAGTNNSNSNNSNSRLSGGWGSGSGMNFGNQPQSNGGGGMQHPSFGTSNNNPNNNFGGGFGNNNNNNYSSAQQRGAGSFGEDQY